MTPANRDSHGTPSADDPGADDPGADRRRAQAAEARVREVLDELAERDAQLARLRRAQDAAVTEARRRVALESRVAELEAYTAELEARVVELAESARAAAAEAATCRHHLDLIEQTLTWRAAAVPRQLWGRVRRRGAAGSEADAGG